jgi:hypothetical protein
MSALEKFFPKADAAACAAVCPAGTTTVGFTPEPGPVGGGGGFCALTVRGANIAAVSAAKPIRRIRDDSTEEARTVRTP